MMEDALVLGCVAGGGGQPRLVWASGGCTPVVAVKCWW